jgi:ATP-dependent Lon protease
MTTKSRAPGNPVLPVLPLRDIVVFPHMIVPLFVGREKSIRARRGDARDKQILLATQKNAEPTTIRRPTRSTRPARSPPCCSC